MIDAFADRKSNVNVTAVADSADLPTSAISAEYRSRVIDVLAIPSNLLKGKKVNVGVHFSITTTIEADEE